MSNALQDISRLMRLSSAIYFHEDFPEPWGMKIEKGPYAQFHLVTSGTCWLETEVAETAQCLEEGDIVVFFTGEPHILADKPGRATVKGQQVVAAIHNNEKPFNGNGDLTSIICGHFALDDAVKLTLLPLLPPLVMMRRSELENHSWLETVTKLIIEETRIQGQSVVAERLAEALLVGILRHASSKAEKAGLLKGLNDAVTRKALGVMHAQPDTRWTIDSLAREIGSSRTVLATRFKESVGIPPMEYLTDVRMTHAMQLLRIGERSTGEIAENVGYLSEASFIRAFKRTFGMTPGKSKRTK